jgi:hypothetical protein
MSTTILSKIVEGPYCLTLPIAYTKKIEKQASKVSLIFGSCATIGGDRQL